MAEQDLLRGCLKNTPFTFWGQSFASLASNNLELESHSTEIEALKEQVKNMLLDSTKDLAHNIRFINLLCRLGISYHFDDEIDTQLNHISTMLPKLLGVNNFDLSTAANLFRVLRQYGYNITCDVFEKYKDGDGVFKKEITNDVEGMLCLYEACFLAIPGEDILDKALLFTRKHLQVIAENPSSSLQKHIRNSLMFPSHRTEERLDAFNYISFYSEHESANETLLKFAKIDYNRLQLLYKKELALLSKWSKDIGLVEKLPYARDRIVESFMWSTGSIFEPQYSLARMMLCKYAQLIAVLDDTYDSYGTTDELKLFTAALQKFAVDSGENLPEYLRNFYKIFFEDLETNCSKGCENTIAERYSYKTSYHEEMIKELVREYIVELHWRKERIAPCFDDYIKNGKVTSTFEVLTSSCIIGMDNIGLKEILWLRSDPDIVTGAKLVCRFLNDVAGRKDKTNRGDFPKVLDCYTKQYGVSRDEAFEEIRKLLDDKWKKMNEDVLKYSNTIPRILLKHCLNYARNSEVFYADIDLYTYGSNTKELIELLFIKPIPM